MRTYVMTTGLLYVALLLAHVARLVDEGLSPLHSPSFVGTSIIAALLAAWSWRIHRTLP